MRMRNGFETWVLAMVMKHGLETVRDHASGPFYEMLGQTHVNECSHVVAFQNEG